MVYKLKTKDAHIWFNWQQKRDRRPREFPRDVFILELTGSYNRQKMRRPHRVVKILFDICVDCKLKHPEI